MPQPPGDRLAPGQLQRIAVSIRLPRSPGCNRLVPRRGGYGNRDNEPGFFAQELPLRWRGQSARRQQSPERACMSRSTRLKSLNRFALLALSTSVRLL
jgi:hypothetical protein